MMWWPLRLMVTSWRGLRVRMMRLMLIPVASWRWRATARAVTGDGEMGLDGVAGAVEDGAGPQVVLAHPEGRLDVPQLVVGGDHLGGVHQTGRDER